jgi:hypothetical protein
MKSVIEFPSNNDIPSIPLEITVEEILDATHKRNPTVTRLAIHRCLTLVVASLIDQKAISQFSLFNEEGNRVGSWPVDLIATALEDHALVAFPLH